MTSGDILLTGEMTHALTPELSTSGHDIATEISNMADNYLNIHLITSMSRLPAYSRVADLATRIVRF